ncbi:hypothetical protein CRM22_010290 [Opisthorchis felineus]|uniref:Uncharacterized protein n=1 Tax=Opisthorchis felineus TaxID=147828 RepID=A0A4S2L5K6_OPIFE|nr:hypothetical protein CRM22_010290 [Opisthorchis felineus]
MLSSWWPNSFVYNCWPGTDSVRKLVGCALMMMIMNQKRSEIAKRCFLASGPEFTKLTAHDPHYQQTVSTQYRLLFRASFLFVLAEYLGQRGTFLATQQMYPNIIDPILTHKNKCCQRGNAFISLCIENNWQGPDQVRHLLQCLPGFQLEPIIGFDFDAIPIRALEK